MLILDRRDVEALLDLDPLIDAVGVALSDLSAGRASVPGRTAAFVEENNATGLLDMPSYVPSLGVLTTKLVTVSPGNAETGLPGAEGRHRRVRP